MLPYGSKPFAIRSLLIVALCATLLSFSEKTGTDSFTIYLNDKLILQQNVRPDISVKNISLTAHAANDILKIHYSHCGKTGSGRSIAIQDDQNRVLKTWDFSNHISPVMTCSVKDILPLLKNTEGLRLHLMYSSKEIPGGKVLAAITASNGNKASLH